MPEVVEADGNTAEFLTLNTTQYEIALTTKLQEEMHEYLDALANGRIEDAAEELADMLEVQEALAAHYHGSIWKVRAIQAVKKKKRGGFVKRLYMTWAKKTNGNSN